MTAKTYRITFVTASGETLTEDRTGLDVSSLINGFWNYIPLNPSLGICYIIRIQEIVIDCGEEKLLTPELNFSKRFAEPIYNMLKRQPGLNFVTKRGFKAKTTYETWKNNNPKAYREQERQKRLKQQQERGLSR